MHIEMNYPKLFGVPQAAACTEVGCGSFTPPVFGDSGIETPVPRLLLSTGDAVQITDCDKRENQTLSRSGAVVDLAYSSHDDRVYWIDDNNHLVTSRLYTPEKTKVREGSEWFGTVFGHFERRF